MRPVLTRLKSPLLALLAIAASLAVLDVALRAALGADPDWLPPRFYDYGPYFGSRIARIEQLKRDGKLDERSLVVMLGTSAVQYDLDPRIIENNDPENRRWLLMAPAGATIRNLEIGAEPFLNSSLHPSLILVGIHAWMLHRRDYLEHDTGLVWLNRHSWLTNHHLALNNLFIIERDRAAAAVGRLFNLPPWEVYEPAPDPWQSSYDFPTTQLLPADMAGQFAMLQFEMKPSQFSHNDVEVDSLRRLILALREHSPRVICVLMPESSSMRPYPPAAEASLHRAVADLQPLQMIDLRAAIPDALMHDHTHTNSAGRDEFSAMLPALVH
jgi:hypothetical protein